VTAPVGANVPDSVTNAVQTVAPPTITLAFAHVTIRRVTSKLAETLWVPSLTAIVWFPRAAEAGTVNVQVGNMLPNIVPVELVVQSVGIPAVEPSNVTIRECEWRKFEPIRVTVVPAAPIDGAREIEGGSPALANWEAPTSNISPSSPKAIIQ